MKKIIFSIIIAALFAACGNKNNLQILGTVEEGVANGDTLHLVCIHPDGSLQNIASSVVKSGTFELQGTVETPVICNIVKYNNEGNVERNIDVVADGSPLSVVVLKNYACVSGSPLNEELQRYNDSVALMKRLYQRYYDKKAQNPHLSEKAIDEADKVMAVTAMHSRNIVYRAIERNIDNIVGLHIIKTNFNILEPTDALRFIDNLPIAHKNDYLVSYMQKYYTSVLKYAIGQPYADFVLPDAEGNYHYLSGSVGRGKPVILSFWVSNNKKSLDEQKKLGNYATECGSKVSFIGVSIDTNREQWLATINSQSPAGLQLADFKGWNNAVLSIYGIDKCPYYILIDKNGIISYRGLVLNELISASRALIKM